MNKINLLCDHENVSLQVFCSLFLLIRILINIMNRITVSTAVTNMELVTKTFYWDMTPFFFLLQVPTSTSTTEQLGGVGWYTTNPAVELTEQTQSTGKTQRFDMKNSTIPETKLLFLLNNDYTWYLPEDGEQ